MRNAFQTVILAIVGVVACCRPALAQTAPDFQAGTTMRLSIDDAVRLALERNLGIQADRLTPQIQDLAIVQAQSSWIPSLTSALFNNSQNNPPTSALSGGQTNVTDSQFSTEMGISQQLRSGGSYSASWNSARATSSNVFTNFDPLLSSNISFSFTQPFMRNFKIDDFRQQLEASRNDRNAAEVQLQSTIAATTRDVKNAYWELVYQIDNLSAQQRSLDLAKRLLADNERRVQIGTMAPIDIVEAQAEVARNEEAVIVAEAGIRQAEDSLRALIYDPGMPNFWEMTLAPTETMPFTAQTVDPDAAIRRAVTDRTDVLLSRNDLTGTNIRIRFYENQVLPDLSAQASYRSNGVGGIVLSPLTSIPLGGTVSRAVLSERGYGAVLGDVFSSAFPTWTFGVSLSYPIGTSSSEASLARARLEHSQGEIRLRNLELQIATEVRDAARQVQTNQKRVDSARAARALAERRLEAEEKKFAAGMQISFFVFQAQRDLGQARTNEIRAIADYNKSLVDFEAVQQTALR